ncbi:MAG: hypothetical protein QM674_13995 [Burkholderiaceae bacterium]
MIKEGGSSMRCLKLFFSGFLIWSSLGTSLADTRLANTANNTAVYATTDAYTPTVYEMSSSSRPCWGSVAILPSNYAPLAAKTASVPLPCNFTPSEGTDKEAVILDYTHGSLRVFEGWQLNKSGGNWSMAWGGYEPESAFTKTAYGWAWPTSESMYGVQASGLAFLPGIITVKELSSGKISHAIHMIVPRSCNTWVSPATRTDGSSVPTGTLDCYQYGMAYKLPSNFVIPSNWPNVVKMIAVAARDYGLVVTDQSGYGIGFRFENYKRPEAWWSNNGAVVDPYSDPTQAGLNFFQCPNPWTWACYPDGGHLFKPLSQVVAPNSQSFWQALVRVN